MQKKSIIQVIDMLNPGGAERVLVTLSNLQYANGHKVKVITTVKPGPLAKELHEGIPLQNLQRGFKWNPFTMYRFIKEVKGFDIVHVHSIHNLRYLLLAKKLFGLNKKIFYHEHHGHRINTKATLLEKKLFQHVIFIAVSTQLKNWAINEAGVNERKCFVLPNIIIKKQLPAVSVKKDNVIQLLLISNFVPVKNIEHAILVLAQLGNQKNKQYHLTIVGTISDRSYYNAVIQIIKEKNLEDLVSFIHDCTDAQTILSQYDLALHTSTSESGPLVLIEYMAQGLLFITYETGEVVQQLKNNWQDFVLQSFSIDEWEERILLLLKNNNTKMQHKLRIFFDDNYSPEAYYKKCMQIYNEGLSL